MRIGIDIDNTISETTKQYIKMINEYCKDNEITIEQFKNNKNCEIDCFKKYGLNNIKKIAVKKGAIEVLNLLKKNNKIIIITARSNKQIKNLFDFDAVTKNWLKDNNIYYDEYYGSVYGDEKTKICIDKKIDLMIDDDINNYNAIKSAGINVKLFDDERLHLDCKDRIDSWEDIKK